MLSSRADHALSVASSAALDVRYNSVASLCLLVWHLFITLDDEVQYIWTMRNMNYFKWLYFLLRYPIILLHITHNLFLERLANGSNPPLLCAIWYGYIFASSQYLGTLLELTLTFRVFAFYNRSKKVAFLLLTVILVEAAGSVRSISLQRTAEFYGTCLLIRPNKHGMLQSLLGFSVHCTLIILTLFQYFSTFRAGLGRSPLVALVVHHGAMVYTIVIAFVVFKVILYNSKGERGVILVFWVTSLISISGCKVILNMERLANGEIFAESADPLTSGIDIGTAEG